MATWLLISNLLLWLVAIGLAVALYGLYAHFGQIYLSSRENRSHQGPAIGTRIQERSVRDYLGAELTVPPVGRRTLMVFASTTCEPCLQLKPHLEEFNQVDTELVVVCAGSSGAVREWARDLPSVRVVADVDKSLSEHYQIDFTPVGIGLTRGGVTVGGGIVNDSRHLNALVDEIAAFEERQFVLVEN